MKKRSGKSEKVKMEYRYYDMPPNEPVLALLGDGWKRRYGEGIEFLHFHNILEIGYCNYGRGELTYDMMEDRLLSVSYTGGEVSIIPRSVPHTTNSAPGSVCFWEYLFVDVGNFLSWYEEKNPMQAEKIIERINARPLLIPKGTHAALTEIVKEIIRAQTEKQPYYTEVTDGLVFSLLMLIAQANRDYAKQNVENSTVSRQIRSALVYVEKNYAKDLQVKDLSDACHMSETHFRRLFGQSMNMSPVEYINLVRVQKACELLNKTNYSMETVAGKTGFQTVSTFNRNFNRVVGSSPYHWKTHYKNYEKKAQEFKISAHKGWE